MRIGPLFEVKSQPVFNTANMELKFESGLRSDCHKLAVFWWVGSVCGLACRLCLSILVKNDPVRSFEDGLFFQMSMTCNGSHVCPPSLRKMEQQEG